MEASLFFRSIEEVDGIDIYESNGEKFDSWEYGGGGVDYRQFIVDCLNGDYFSIASGCFPVAPSSDNELTSINNTMIAIVKEEYKNRRLQYDGLYNYFIESFPERVKQCEVVKKDLALLDMEYYRKAVESVYVNEKFPRLNLLQKFYAFDRSWTRMGNPVDREINVKIHFQANCDTELADSLDSAHCATYNSVCQAICSSQSIYAFRVGRSYTFPSLRDVFKFLFAQMIEDGLILKKCPNCGRFFAPDKKSEVYCDMPSPEMPIKTCSEYVKYQKYLNKTHEESARLHKQIYNKKANRVRRTGNSKLKADLEQFKKDSELWRSFVRTGQKKESEYITWLQKVKSQ